MGARHIAAVYANWHHLPDPAFRLLTYMALVAKDEASDPRFWAGRRSLAFAIGRGVGDDDDIPNATHQAVKRAVKTLTSAGAVTGVHGGYRGKNMEYQLHLAGPGKGYAGRTPIDPEPEGERGTPGDPERGTPGDQKGVRPTTQRGTPGVPPRRIKEDEERKEEENSPLTQPSPSAHDGETTDLEIDPNLTHIEAKRIVREAAESGVDVAAITAGRAFVSKTQRDLYTATILTTQRQAS